MENYTQTTRFILSCVTPDTNIVLPNELEINISEFIDQFEYDTKHIHLKNLDSDISSIKEDLVLAAVKLPASSIGKRVLKITTSSGRIIKVTDDHKLLTTRGWTEAGQLDADSKLLIYPSLEGTTLENNPSKIVDLDAFVSFLSSAEEGANMKGICHASSYRELRSVEKQKILKRIAELKQQLLKGDGLTPREHETYNIIRESNIITRSQLQNKLGLTRYGTNYLISSLVRKGYVKRTVDKKIHSFRITGREAMVLRNDMDIKRIIESEFQISVAYSVIRRSSEPISRGRVDNTLGYLRRKNLLDLTYNDIDKIGALSRLCGFLLGDGHLAENSVRLHFSGNRDALLNVQKDLALLGLCNYSKISSVKIQNNIAGRKVVGHSTSFTVDSRPFFNLLEYLGIPKGDKCAKPYSVPLFIKKGTKFVKREFIRALFGCDADQPSCNRMNFGAMALRQNKIKGLSAEMQAYMDDIKELLSEFGVASYLKIIDKGEIRKKDMQEVYTYNLIVAPNNQNLFRYFTRIGFAYEDYKVKMSRICSEYLRHKLYLVSKWKQKAKSALVEIEEGRSRRLVAKEYGVSVDFISNQLKGKEVHLPRKEFLDLECWLEQYKYNDTLLINTIDRLEECDEDYVMDLTCQADHNFISNGLISHNCNYSSKVIDPIQSRCSVFRFKPLDKDDIYKIIETIAEKEDLKIGDKAKDAILEVSGGDCRRAENILQSSAAMSDKIKEDIVFSMASIAKPKEIKEVLDLALKNKFISAREKLLDTMLKYGLSGADIIKQIQREIWNLDIDARSKVMLVDKCGEIEFRMTEGSDEYLQLEALLANFTLCSSS